jgi:ubiquinone/menaquinone biosynthesis C-methylase UbiE
LHHFADPRLAVTEMVRVCRSGGRVVLSDLVAPSSDERGALDRLHRSLDPSHVRLLLEDELAAIFPAGVRLSYGETSTFRFPLRITFSDQSDRDAVIDALRAEIAGGAPSGFDPTEDDGELVVSFTTCVVHGTVA